MFCLWSFLFIADGHILKKNISLKEALADLSNDSHSPAG
jgi:hypothetical protein